MAVASGVMLVIYLWNAPHAIDFPEYDEADYFFRGYRLLQGDFRTADILNVHSSPLVPIYYALWFLFLHTSLLYPWVMASSLFLMGMGAYLLLSRVLHPALSWILALVAVMTSAPFAPGNANFYLGAGILWLSLALLGEKVWQRGLAALGVLITLYVRPEFALVLALLLILLIVYERRQLRRGVVSRRSVAFAYAPLAIGLVLSAYLLFSAPAGSDYRTAATLPYSYNVYLEVNHYPGFNEATNYADPWILFENDFGQVQPRTLPNSLLAMLRNPAKMRAYFSFDVARLGASFGTAAFTARGWALDEWSDKLPVGISPGQSQLALFEILMVAICAAGCYIWLRVGHQLHRVPIRLHGPALIGIVSLVPLVSILILINPTAIFFFLYPLVLFLVGIGVTLILTALRVGLGNLVAALPRTIGRMAALVARPLASILVVMLMLLALPHPYATTGIRPIARTIAFLQQNVPSGSTIVGEPVTSYGDFLAADGIDLHTISLANYPDSGLVGAFEANPDLGYVLLTRLYSQSNYDHWFAEWQATFPNMPWTLVAQQSDPQLALYRLPAHPGGVRLASYLVFLQADQQLGIGTKALPAAATLDVSRDIGWVGANPQNDTHPAPVFAWQATVSCIVMHPYYPGMPPAVSSQVSASLPPAWSGRSLLFLDALAPWAADQPGADGVRLIFTLNGTSYQQVVELPNVYPHRWVPVIVHLPAFQSGATLTLSIQPRVSINFDSTLLGFIGVLPTGG
jgi:hypothetical protein